MFKHIILFVMLVMSPLLFGQHHKIKGTILDENKFPVAGVSIQLQTNPNIATQTDANGLYTLSFTPNGKEITLEIIKEGFEKQTAVVTLQNNENRITYVDFTLPKEAIALEEVVVSDNPSLIANSESLSRKKLDKVPGGTNIANLKDLSEKRSQTLKDALVRQPGVVIQEFFGGNDQPRLNIRGSGIQSNPQSRGVALYQDGIPINFADGSYIIGVLEPQASNLVEVYRGANAMEYGGATLGGAMNFVTKNGYNASPLSVKMEAGSFNYLNSSLSSGFSSGKNDGFISTSYSKSDGYRTYNSSKRFNALLNIGRQFTNKFETRLYASFTDLYFDIPGPLTKQQYESDSKQINGAPKLTVPYAFGPNVQRDKPNRASKIARFGSKSAYKFNNHSLLTATLYYQYADDAFVYPIATNIRHDYNNDYGLRLTYDYNTRKNDLSIGVQLSQGKMHQLRNINERGSFGALFAKQDLLSNHAVAYISDVYKITDKFLVNIAVQGSYDTRKVEDKFEGSSRPISFFAGQNLRRVQSPSPVKKLDNEYTYNAVNPKAGVIYKFSDNAQVYGNYSFSYEPPTFLEIIRLTGGAAMSGTQVIFPNSSNANSSAKNIAAFELKAQKAQTAEIGTKGNIGDAFVWNVSAYHSWVKDEIFTLTDGEIGINGITVNAPYTTVHRGVEAALQSTFAKRVFSSKGDAFTLFVNYNYSDFFFDGGALKGNQIAGIPKHYIYGALDYKHPSGFFAEFNVEALPEDTPTDHKNTYYQDTYQLLGAKIGFKKGNWTFFFQGNNLADTVYASSYLIQDQVTPPPAKVGNRVLRPTPTIVDKTNFIPGVGRNFVGGITYTW